MPNPEEKPPAWRRRAVALELAALLLAAAFAMVFHARLPGRLPKDEDYNQVASVLGTEAQPGDVLLLYPWWTERARLFAPDNLPVVGYLGSETEPLTDYPRIWVLAQPHLPKADLSGFLAQFEKGRQKLSDTRSFGNLELTLYRNDRFRPPLFSAREKLANAHVYIERGGERSDCQWTGHGHQCGRVSVGRGWHEVNQIPRDCLTLSPPGGDSKLVLEWQGIPPGDRISVEGGIVWEYAAHHSDELSDVNVTVEDGNGQKLAGFTAQKGVETFYRESAASPQTPFNLRLIVQANNPAERQMCLNLAVRGAAADKEAP